MRIVLQKYNQNRRIVSLALTQEAKRDLSEDDIEFIYVSDKSVFIYPEDTEYECQQEMIDTLRSFNDYDVLDLWPDGSLYRYYDNSSIDNYFFITGKCNSNCIMCPSPDASRKNGKIESSMELIEYAKHIPCSAPHLTITGGEPFMMGEEIFEFMHFLQEKYEETEFLILTNGRIFSINRYVNLLKQNAPNNTLLGIPVHGSNAEIHDSITQTKGSFCQTMQGVKKLLSIGMRVEIRVVINKLNAGDFENIADLLIQSYSQIDHVSIIAMEMTGNAFRNKDIIWISYRECFDKISKGIDKLIMAGIDTRLYNFPLCTVKRKYWMLCEKSISPEKVRFHNDCSNCTVKNLCGGLFAGTIGFEKNELKAIGQKNEDQLFQL